MKITVETPSVRELRKVGGTQTDGRPVLACRWVPGRGYTAQPVEADPKYLCRLCELRGH